MCWQGHQKCGSPSILSLVLLWSLNLRTFYVRIYSRKSCVSPLDVSHLPSNQCNTTYWSISLCSNWLHFLLMWHVTSSLLCWTPRSHPVHLWTCLSTPSALNQLHLDVFFNAPHGGTVKQRTSDLFLERLICHMTILKSLPYPLWIKELLHTSFLYSSVLTEIKWTYKPVCRQCYIPYWIRWSLII